MSGASRDRARAGMSLLEVVVSIALAGVVLAPLYETARLTSRAAGEARAAAAADERAERVRATLGRLIHDGRVVPALSIGRDGALREEAVDGAPSAWRATAALVVRGPDAYHVVERTGERLVVRRLGLDGQVTTITLADGVAEARFGVVGTALVEYEVRFVDRRVDARGVLAPRVSPPAGGLPPAPTLAPRLGTGGDR